MIVDFRVNTPNARGIQVYIDPPEFAQGYVDTYRSIFGEKVKEYLMSPKQFLEYMDHEGVDVAVFPAGDNESTMGRKYPNEELAEFVQQNPKRFIGLAGADPHKGMKAVKELEHAIARLGLKGLNIGPWMQKIHANDKKYYPLYAKCMELNIPVVIHTSINFLRHVSMDFGRPIYLDEVAMDFPELKIVASHGGWPWVPELIGVCWRHPNVFVEIAAIRPKYIGVPGTGWETLLQYGNTLLQDRVLFATDWPMLPMSRSIGEVKALPLKEEVKKKWLGDNAAQLLRL
jgi:predicted TIM-barrel fold metal-dependent hydrolase